MRPAFVGLAGTTLSDDERAFFREAEPAGYVLFGRNVQDRAQLRALTDSLRALAGRDDLPILIDQEGGPVARLGPPEWQRFPAAERFAALYGKAPISAIEAARLHGLAIAAALAGVGITVDCAPVLDLLYPGAHAVIGKRSFGGEPKQVAALGRAMLEGLEQGGVVGVIKHVPGHGRARADSHVELPVVTASEAELERDIAPFRALAGAPMAMTAHVLFEAWDAERPATISPIVIEQVIRGRIGFDGLLMSDDIAMEALAGTLAERAKAAIGAGCDIALHCSGVLGDAEQVVGALDPVGDAARARLDRAMARAAAAGPVRADIAERRDALLAIAES